MSKNYPKYGFEKHKGYPTKQHLKALKEFGPCPIHRTSYAPVRDVINQQVSLFD
jgi:ribonuclease HII